ncbi:hypothetical protein [Roseomonas xinghualingensis]|nr:hypothetical protein [Roseomonas sp. SXEYE001]MCV4206159.1 hypothetical protein [Roseomonas sp. SXEYE001]
MLHAPTTLTLSFALAVTCGAILLILWVKDRRHPRSPAGASAT